MAWYLVKHRDNSTVLTVNETQIQRHIYVVTRLWSCSNNSNRSWI